jgi:Sec-independent protein translocase protein TatA
MDILGIGMPELIFIILIALIVLGPKDMQKSGKTIGTFLRKVVMSSEWRTVKDVSRKVSTLPNQWMREANEDLQKFSDGIEVTMPNVNDSFGSSGDSIKNTPARPSKSASQKSEISASEGFEAKNIIAPLSSGIEGEDA